MTTRSLWLGLGLISLFSGCSLITGIDECAVPEDCAVQGSACTDGVCIPPGAAEPCTVDRCIADRGLGYVCSPSNECVQATTAQCARAIGPINNSKAVIFGSILPLSNGFEGLGGPIEQGVDLAVREINEAGGLGDGRVLVVISCDDGANLDQAKQVTHHLVDTLGAQAIVGPAFSGIYLAVANEITVPAGVVTMSPSATSPLISDIQDNGLAWRTAASDKFQGVALGDFIAGRRQLRRIVALGKDDAYGRGLLDAVSPKLVDLLGADNFRGRVYPDPSKVMNPDYTGAVVDVLTQLPNPDAVVLLGTTESIEVMQIVEQQLAATSSTTEYFFADGGKLPEMLMAMRDNPSLERRVFGTEADHMYPGTFTKFSLRFQQAYNVAAPGIYAANSYDAVYALAGAAMTVPPTVKTTGRALVDGLGHLVDGRAVEVGPTDFGLARSVLGSGGKINLTGASGPLDFDVNVGEAPANVALWLVRQGPAGYRFESGGTYQVMGASGEWQLR